MATLPAGASGSGGAGSGAGRDSAAASLIGMMVRRAVGLTTDAAGTALAAVALRRGPVTTPLAFGAGLPDLAVDPDELEEFDAPGESAEPESAEATALATAEPVPATTPAIATPRHTCLIVATSSSPILCQLLHSCVTD